MAQNGTLRLPQALLSLLKTTRAGSPSHPVTQTDSHLVPWNAADINKSVYRFLNLLTPFVLRHGNWSLTPAGMVELTALCGVASALWIRRKRTGKTRPGGTQHASEAATGTLVLSD